MEAELRDNLFAIAKAFAAKRELQMSTIGRLCAGDSQFFDRLTEGKSFTARKYDAVLVWFSENWPEGAEWPASIDRPEKAAA